MTNWYDDAPTVQIHKVESRVSRIPRRCHGCNQTINRGDRYVHAWGVEDGESAWDNRHVRCSYEYGYSHE